MVSALIKKKACDVSGIPLRDSMKRTGDFSNSDERESKKRVKEDRILKNTNEALRNDLQPSSTNAGQSTSTTENTSLSKSDKEAEIVALLMEVQAAARPPSPSLKDVPIVNDMSSSERTDENHCNDANVTEDTSGYSNSTTSDTSAFESGFMSFPEKIMMLLNKNLAPDAMWWLPDGDAFCILPAPFTEKVLDKHFQGTKFESFTRKLNRWGFKRVAGDGIPSNAIAFFHNSFHKNKPELLKEMSGGKAKSPIQNPDKKASTKERCTSSSLEPALQTSTHSASSRSFDSRGQKNTGLSVVSNPLMSEDGSLAQMQELASARSAQEARILGSSIDSSAHLVTGGPQQVPSLNCTDPSPQLRSLLAQQLGINRQIGIESRPLQPIATETLLGDQLLRARNMNQLPNDLILNLAQQRTSELEQLLSSSDALRLIAQQRETLPSNYLTTQNQRLLLQHLSSPGTMALSDINNRLLARGGAIGPHNVGSETSSMLEHLHSSQVNPDQDLALRLLLAQQRVQGDQLNNATVAALLRQQVGRGSSFNSVPTGIQQQFLSDRWRAPEIRSSSGDLVQRLLTQQLGGGQSFDSADLRTRLMLAAANNARVAQSQPLAGVGLSEQQLYELYLLEQQRDIRLRQGQNAFGR